MSRRRKSLPVYLTPAESERLLAAARTPRDRCLFAVMLLAGLRSAEACGLRVERIDLARGELLVFRGKGGRDRLLPISARLAPLLREQIGARTEGYLFPGRKPDQQVLCRVAARGVRASRTPLSCPEGANSQFTRQANMKSAQTGALSVNRARKRHSPPLPASRRVSLCYNAGAASHRGPGGCAPRGHTGQPFARASR